MTPPPLERLSTGNPALDGLMDGGFPKRSVIVVAGEPGSGKTTFALEMLFAAARAGIKSVYFTTLSEPAIKLIRYMQLFDFYDERFIDDRIVFADLGSAVRAHGPEAALETANARMESEDAEIVVIDSFKAIHDLLGEPARSRTFVYDLAISLASWGATSFLVGEYTADELARQPEFAIADGILRFGSERQELTTIRTMEVLKMRGARYTGGRHFYEIGTGGVTFYPRVRAPEDVTDTPAAAKTLATGIAGLDELLRGGLRGASATLVEGGTGSGKTLIGLHFLVEGARRGERGVFFGLEESPDQVRAISAGFGWDIAAFERAGLIELTHTSPVEISSDKFLHEARACVQRFGAQRAVVDSLSGLSLGIPSDRRFREVVYAITKHFRALGTTLVMTMETAQLMGTTQLAGHGVSTIADNVIMLRYVELGGGLTRAISVLKARGVSHGAELRRMSIGPEGAVVGAAFSDMRGVLTGVPVPVATE